MSHTVAMLDAYPADIRADSAVVVHASVAGAFVAAGLACRGARLQDRAGQVGVVAGVSRQHPTGGVAQISAVQVGTNALGQIGNHILAETGVCASGAYLGTGEAGVDTRGEGVTVNVAQVGGIRVQHGDGVRHSKLLPSD